MIYGLDYEKLQHNKEDPFKDYTEKYIHKNGKIWNTAYNDGKTDDIRSSIDDDYAYIISDHFSDDEYFAVPCFKLTVDGKDYIAMCDIDTVFDNVPTDFTFERDITKIMKTYNQNRMPRTVSIPKYDGKIPPHLRSHKTTPKRKSGICQLENSVRRMF